MAKPQGVRLIVGGENFELSRSLLDMYPNTMLSKSASERWQKDPDSEITWSNALSSCFGIPSWQEGVPSNHSGEEGCLSRARILVLRGWCRWECHRWQSADIWIFGCSRLRENASNNGGIWWKIQRRCDTSKYCSCCLTVHWEIHGSTR